MPRSSRKSVSTPTSAGKRVTRGVVGLSRQSKSPAKSPPETPVSQGRSRSTNSKKSVTTSPVVKKTVSPSPKPTRAKGVSTPETSTRRGRSTGTKTRKNYQESEEDEIDEEDEEPVVHKKGKKAAKSPSKSKQQSASKGKQKSATKVSKGKKSSNTKTTSPSASPVKAEKVTSSRSAKKRSSTKKAVTGELESNRDGPEDEEKSSEMETASPEKTDAEQKTSDSRKRKHDEVEKDLMKKSETEPDTKAQKLSDEISDTVSSHDKKAKACETSDADTAEDDGSHSVDSFAKNMEAKPVENVGSESNAEAEAEEPTSPVAVNESEYEIISKDDVPPADSDEIIKAAEQMVPPPPSAVISTPSNGCSGNGCDESDTLLSREFVTNEAVGGELDAARSFSIVSYNVLANCHSQKDFAGEKAPWITDEQLSQHSRHQQLIKELKYLNSDIVCLQEVEGSHMTDLLTSDMEALGYKGLFIPRNTTDYCEGEATFYRSNRFTLLASKSLILKDAINEAVDASTLDADLKEQVKLSLETHAVAMIVHLKDVNSADEIAVANIHVAYDKLLRLDRKCIQISQTLHKLIDLVGGTEKPHIICGDFNSQPHTAPYQFVTTGHLNSDSMEQLQSEVAIEKKDGQTAPVVNIWPDGFQFPAGGDLKSSYSIVLGDEPLTSRFASDGILRSVDYIWFSSVSLDILGVLKVVDPAVIQPGVPSGIFPSDHMSLKSCLAFK